MLRIIQRPAVIEAAGYPPKRIEEYFGRANSDTEAVSIARMTSPAGWQEPGQRPAFDEYTVVLDGMLMLETEDAVLEVEAGQAVLIPAGTWVRYATPRGAEYIAVCLPAFSPHLVHRDA
jgi:quercetin dioxygenase-like cupin family protein